ncbi:flagellar biosynthetic protein FliP [Clostridia bacterium]|nr:flagellar biosynthetic protein FliP [Clostridia bacterium]
MKKLLKALCLLVFGFVACNSLTFAEGISVNVNGRDTSPLDILFLTTLLTLLPTIVLLMTCFTRIVIVFSFLKNAMGTAQVPPSQVIVGLSLCLTFFIMSPVVTDINEHAYKPYREGKIEWEQALKAAEKPLKKFMRDQTNSDDLALFMKISKTPPVKKLEDLGMTTVVPAFIVSEIKKAFVIGFCLFIPFIVIDMVVSSILMSLGMMMLPPAMISLPFKILLFILADGWDRLIVSLVDGFRK